MKIIKDGVSSISKGCSKLCVNLKSRVRTLANGELETCCSKNLCNSTEIRFSSSFVSIRAVSLMYIVLWLLF